MTREIKLFIEDILQSIDAIELFTKKLSKKDLSTDRLHQSAIVRELEIIGEAVKNIPENIRNKYPPIEWKKIAGMRDIIIHTYFKLNLDSTWDTIKNDLPVLKKQMNKVLDDMEKNDEEDKKK
jgi:uncharacterized protein with HEPN domain